MTLREWVTIAAALALSSDGEVSWRVESIADLRGDLDGELARLFARLADAGEAPRLAYLVSDFRVDVSELEASLRERATR